jgi:hypothetical protein
MTAMNKSASNLHQIGLAIQAYTQNHGGEFPESLSRLVLDGEASDSAVFISPLRSDTPAKGPNAQAIANQMTAGGHVSYTYLGRGLNESTLTPDTIIAYELVANTAYPVIILTADGTVLEPALGAGSETLKRIKNGPFPATVPSPYNGGIP